MKTRSFVLYVVLVCLGTIIALTPRHSYAEPILKPRKYHGPIPQRFLTVNIGAFGGADNSVMWEFLEGEVQQPLQNYTETNDFGTSLALDVIFAKKIHPQFAVRTKGGVSFLQSDNKGFFFPAVSPDTLLLRFDREFNVLLFSLDATALFFFQDASVKEFQTYIGGGFSLFFPYAEYKEDQTVAELIDDEPVDTGEPFASGSSSDWSVEPGVHAILGFLYHFKTTWAFTAEGRVQIAQSKFSIDYPTEDGVRPLNFTVDYTGFVLSVGVARFF